MSRPSAGNYIIYNRVLSPTGEKLAINSHGIDQFVTVERHPYADDSFYIYWTIQDVDANTQAVISNSLDNTEPDLQAASDAQGVKVVAANGHVWVIRGGDKGYTVQDSRRTAIWGLEDVRAGEKVTITADQGGPNQRWVFQKQ